MAIHVTKYFATIRKPLNDSLRFRWEFVDLDDLLTKFQRFFCGKMLWQNILPQTTSSLKCWCIFDFWGVAKCFVTTFLHQKKPWNFVKISLGKRPNPRNPNEILTKQNRQNPVIQGLDCKWSNIRVELHYNTYIHIYVCIYVYYNIYIYLCL